MAVVTLLVGCAGNGTSTDDDAAASSPAASSAAPSGPASSESPEVATPTDGQTVDSADLETESPGTTTIVSPADGDVVPGPTIEFSGLGTAFEGTLMWEIVDPTSRATVRTGFVTAGANGSIGPFTFTADLTPGDYVVEVWEPDMTGAGEDPRHNAASTAFSVS